MTGLTMGLRRAAVARTNMVAVSDGPLHLTWLALRDRVSRLAGAFRSCGAQPGDRVALLAMNGHHSIETYFAALWAGAIIAPFNHRLAEAELAEQMADAAPSILIVDATCRDLAERVTAKVPSIGTVLFVGHDTVPSGMQSYEQIINRSESIPDAGRSGDDVACMFYTGGTTGAAKGVLLTHANIMANSINFIVGAGVDDRIVHLHCGPLFHVAAGVRLFSVTLLGGRHVTELAEQQEVLLARTVEATVGRPVPIPLRALAGPPGAGVPVVRHLSRRLPGARRSGPGSSRSRR